VRLWAQPVGNRHRRLPRHSRSRRDDGRRLSSRCGRMSVSFPHKARRPPPSLSPGEGGAGGVERQRRQVKGIHSISSSCPSPSGEGTRGPGVRARPIDQAPGPTSNSGPLAVRRLGRLCAAEGRVANRATDSWPRSGAGASAAARAARRLFPSPFWPVKKGTPHSRSQHQPSIPLPIYPPCPSLSREGSRAPPSRLGEASSLCTKHDACPPGPLP
jgi:hypothetical protein